MFCVKYCRATGLKVNIFFNSLVGLNCSSSLNYWFNLGSMLGMCLSPQIFSGLMLMMNYNSLESFESIMFITIEVPYGWLMKLFHSNNASLIFLVMNLHLIKGLSYSSWRLSGVWLSGLLMMVMIMGAAFSGYVLVGSQMSLWACMVITSLISVFPINGNNIMYTIWGGYSISWLTLQMMVMVHFILPFLVVFVMFFHLGFLHGSGSTSVIFSHSSVEKIPFFPFFWAKDLINILVFMVFFVLMLLFPYSLGEVELFEESNFLSSPAHIVPEWYFCSYYAILRSTPSKGMGVILMFGSILVLFVYPAMSNYMSPIAGVTSPMWMMIFINQIYLSYLGFSPISQPFIVLALVCTYFYFLLHFINMFLMLLVEYSFEV